jgi:hypothetical protein
MISGRLVNVENALKDEDWGAAVLSDDSLRIRLIKQGIDNPENRNKISLDDANLFFLSCVDLTKDGKPYPLEVGISKERFGRFPSGDGSPVTYLEGWIRNSRNDSESVNTILELLHKLSNRLVGTSINKGIARMDLRGWLSYEDVSLLITKLTSRCWMPAADEPLDGGCQDAAKHLVALLRAAKKRRCGVLLRVHS